MRFQAAMTAMALGLVAACAGAQTPLLDYSFDDQANPTANLGSLGAAFDGAVGPGIEFAPFAGGHALFFESVDDGQVRPLGDENAFDIADGDHSIVATVVTTNSEPGAEGGRFVINKEKLGSDDGWALIVRRDGGEAFYAISADGAGVAVTSVTPVNDGAPHEIIGARSGDWLLIAVDGVVEAWTEIPAGFGSTAQNDLHVSIGGRINFPGGPTTGPHDEFLGTIDDAAIYDVAIIDLPCYADCDRSGSLDFSPTPTAMRAASVTSSTSCASRTPSAPAAGRSEVRSQKSGVRGQRSEVRSQRSEVRVRVRGQRSEVRSQKSEVRR